MFNIGCYAPNWYNTNHHLLLMSYIGKRDCCYSCWLPGLCFQSVSLSLFVVVASTGSYSSSAAGDDRSISGSSDSETSHSDSSFGSRLTLWVEPAPTTTAESSRTTSHGEEKLPINPASGPRLPSKPTLSRKLQEIGRQSSSDSGIATGSHSSYSGSFSSYTGSLEPGSPREEYGTTVSLPPFSSPEKQRCTCPVSHTHEYQVPSSLRYLYDTPRSLLEEAREQTEETVSEQAESSAAACSVPESPRDLAAHGSSRTDTHSDCLICCPNLTSSRMLFTTCPNCGGLKVHDHDTLMGS